MAARGMLVIIAGNEWDRVPRALGREDERIPRAAHGEIMDEAVDLANEARRRVRRVNVVGGPEGHTGLRNRVAAGVRVRRTPGGARVSTSMARRDEAIIPRGLDRRQGWRHPVFGNRNQWVRSRPSRPGWFSGPFQDAQDRIEESLTGELERSADHIDRAGNNRFLPG